MEIQYTDFKVKYTNLLHLQQLTLTFVKKKYIVYVTLIRYITERYIVAADTVG